MIFKGPLALPCDVSNVVVGDGLEAGAHWAAGFRWGWVPCVSRASRSCSHPHPWVRWPERRPRGPTPEFPILIYRDT